MIKRISRDQSVLSRLWRLLGRSHLFISLLPHEKRFPLSVRLSDAFLCFSSRFTVSPGHQRGFKSSQCARFHFLDRVPLLLPTKLEPTLPTAGDTENGVHSQINSPRSSGSVPRVYLVQLQLHCRTRNSQKTEGGEKEAEKERKKETG